MLLSFGESGGIHQLRHTLQHIRHHSSPSYTQVMQFADLALGPQFFSFWTASTQPVHISPPVPPPTATKQGKRFGMYKKSQKTCRTLLHMHTRTCMCGALCDLLAAPPPPPLHAPSHASINLKDAPDAKASVCLSLFDFICDAALAHASEPRHPAALHTIWLQTDFDYKTLNPFYSLSCSPVKSMKTRWLLEVVAE